MSKGTYNILLTTLLGVLVRFKLRGAGAEFSNAIIDRASFIGSSLRGTIFKRTVMTGTSFDGMRLSRTLTLPRLYRRSDVSDLIDAAIALGVAAVG